MSFASPIAWAWTAAALWVVLLYLLRRRERMMPVSALYLWDRVRPDTTSRLQRWLPHADVLLALQLLAVVLLAAAAAQPVLHIRRIAGATAIVVDVSAALAADGRSDEARAAAQDILAESTGPWVVVGWADPPRVLVPPTDRRDVVNAGLAQLEATLLDRPSLPVALALLEDPWERIVAITPSPTQETEVEVIRLAPVDNLSVQAFSVRPQPDGSGYQAIVVVYNDTESYRDLQVILRGVGGARALMQSRLVGPGKEEMIELPLIGGLSPAFSVELRPVDAFPWDNVRYCALDTASVLRVRWLGEEDRYLWAAIQAAVSAVRVDEPPWDLTVAVRISLPQMPDGPTVLVEASSPEGQLGTAQAAGTLQAMDHPMLVHMDLVGVRAASVLPPDLPPEAEVVLSAEGVPLLATWETSQGRRVLLSMELKRSNLPLLPSFPVLIRNMLTWLTPTDIAPSYYVGQSVPIPENSRLHGLENVHDVWVPQAPGLYAMENERGIRWIAVNVPGVPLQNEQRPDHAISEPSARPRTGEEPVWIWFLWAALLCLVAEGYLACRRGA